MFVIRRNRRGESDAVIGGSLDTIDWQVVAVPRLKRARLEFLHPRIAGMTLCSFFAFILEVIEFKNYSAEIGP